MNWIKITLFSLCVMGMAQAQEEESALAEGSSFHWAHSGYLAPGFKFTRFNQQWAFMGGAKAGYLLNHVFSVGLAGYKLISPVETNLTGQPELDLQYGGLTIDWIFVPFEVVHGGFSLLVGGGLADLEDPTEDPDNFYVVEPEWFFQGNVTSYLQVVLGFSYRVAVGSVRIIDSRGDDDWGRLSQAAITLQLKLGKFKTDYDP